MGKEIKLFLIQVAIAAILLYILQMVWEILNVKLYGYHQVSRVSTLVGALATYGIARDITKGGL